MTNPVTPNGKALTVKKVFSRETSIHIDINAAASAIWNLLINAANYPNWSSTVISIEGKIAPGEKIKLKSTLDPKRIFTLKVKEFDAEKRLAWGDAMGTRVYTLTKNSNGAVSFYMNEKIGGPLFPLFARMIPAFDAAFEQFAADLKKAAETGIKK
jgi:uncharacterized protein YndB with AHSA1/START domain